MVKINNFVKFILRKYQIKKKSEMTAIYLKSKYLYKHLSAQEKNL